MKAINRTSMAKQHTGKWVALKNDRCTVIASGKSVVAVLRSARRKGIEQPIITRIPRSPKHFIGYHTRR